ncbi:MAG: hypothetical protein AVO33_06990 [delta proteobacterium ML8_F1]|nr:MAG: hypothetical protein AVO33_06990 [delta proteobacterium ML8_F1]
MRFLVVSDTHGDTLKLKKALEREGPLDAVIHLGDFSRDLESVGFKGSRLSVRGNTDKDARAPLERLVELGGRRVWMVHGHQYGVKGHLDRLVYRALELQADIALFGHTHQVLVAREENLTVFNPGSLSLPRDHVLGSYGILEIEGDCVQTKIFRI